ncbi:MAG: glycosyltransferase family 9 protein [Akkermansiaceae bacterium]
MSGSKGMLVALPERWDEACFAVPAVRALERSRLIGALVCKEEQENFWKTVSSLPCFTFSNKSSAGQLAKLLANDWEASLTWEDGIAAKAFAKAKIQRRLGPASANLKKLITHPLQAHEAPTEHRVRLYLNTCEEMGISVNHPELFVPASLGIPAKPQSVLLCPDSDYGPSHEWPLDRWQMVAEHLLEKGKHLTVAGLVSGRNLGKILTSRIGGDIDFFHANPLNAIIPTLSTFQSVIAADGFLPHLAAYTGCTCMTLFGPNDPNWKRPLGKQNVVVKHHVECAPCLSPQCKMDNRCQNELRVADILEFCS